MPTTKEFPYYVANVPHYVHGFFPFPSPVRHCKEIPVTKKYSSTKLLGTVGPP